MCECAGFESAADHVKEARYAFLGEVISSVTGNDGKAVTTFLVLEAFKGKVPAKIKIRHETDSSACGVEFDALSQHLVFAAKVAAARFETDQCEMPYDFPREEYLEILRA